MMTNRIFLLIIGILVLNSCGLLTETAQQNPNPTPPPNATRQPPPDDLAHLQTQELVAAENPAALEPPSSATATQADDGEQQLAIAPEEQQPVDLKTADLWDRIRQGFTLDHSHPGVQRDLEWFASNQAYLDRVAQRARPFLHFIVTETEKRKMPLEIALLPVVESAFQAFAYSHGRAAGIWQFIPGTGRRYGLKQNWWYDGRRDVWASTQAALKYLSALHREFGDWELALAAYNSGSGTVRKAIRKNRRKGKDTDFWSLRRNLPVETRGYVPKLLAISAIVADPERYGISLLSISDSPYLARVELDGQLDLALAAELAELSVEEIYALNPGYNRWATDPNNSNSLLVPLEMEAVFRERLGSLPPDKRIRWERHRIRKGETIGEIAAQYNTTTRIIKKVNKLRGNMIRQGRNLIIPVAMKDSSQYTHTADNRKKKIQNTSRSGRFKRSYRVREGDSFWTISRKFHVGVRQLAKWNGMASRDKLSIGQKLVIWSKRSTKKLTSIDTSRLITPPVDQIKRWIRYKVRRGDSLARIAQKFRLTIKKIKNWNKNLRRKKYLQPGQKLNLYIDVTRQST